MITKINKIRNLGLVFSNYMWNPALPVFKRFNLVYGWNGCGKTSFSRLFAAIGGSSIAGLEYEIEDDQRNEYKQGEPFPDKIRVFNQDYIQQNIKLLEGRANSISILLGEENKKLMEVIEADRKFLTGDPAVVGALGKMVLLAQHQRELKVKSGERDEKFTEIAKTIGTAIGGNALRDYRKPQAGKDFAALSKKAELSTDDLTKDLNVVKQDSLPTVGSIILTKAKFPGEEEEDDINGHLQAIVEQAQMLVSKTVESEAIPRLASHKDISEWVEQGIRLHQKHASQSCEYCLQQIPADRIKRLARHFTEADRVIKEAIDDLVVKLDVISSRISTVQTPDGARMYRELRNDFDKAVVEIQSAQQELLAGIATLVEELKSKKSRTTEVVLLSVQPNPEKFATSIVAANELIAAHNKKTSDFEAVKTAAIQELKIHYLSTIFDAVKQYEIDIGQLGKDIETLRTETEQIQQRIAENLAKVSSKHRACESINKMLATFLGYQELTFTPYSEKVGEKEGEEVAGYQIMRGGKPAVYLSEGEKTAIAFVYFVVHLGDQNFNVQDGIVVVDDPISSLDSNSLYQAFGFLKNATKDAKQVFILTHSFDFLKLLINWRRHGSGTTGYYMIKNHFPTDVRCAYLDKMDKELCEYESEYHYLFKILKQMRDEQDGSIAKAYPIPNVARKVWDTFLMFSVPNGESQYKKMEELKNAGFDQQKLDAVYKFTNDQSHITGAGFNPALVPETKKVVNELFELIEAIAPNHFKIIDTATN